MFYQFLHSVFFTCFFKRQHSIRLSDLGVIDRRLIVIVFLGLNWSPALGIGLLGTMLALAEPTMLCHQKIIIKAKPKHSKKKLIHFANGRHWESKTVILKERGVLAGSSGGSFLVQGFFFQVVPVFWGFGWPFELYRHRAYALKYLKKRGLPGKIRFVPKTTSTIVLVCCLLAP